MTQTGGRGRAGTIALVGGAEFTPPCARLDRWLLGAAVSPAVTVVPTAAKRHPDMAAATARRHFESLGGAVQEAMIRTRDDALDPAWRERLAAAPIIYLAGGEPPYLASVLEGTPAWDGIRDALAGGAVLAGSSAGAMVLCDTMLRPGSTATEPGLGLLADLVVLPHFSRWRSSLEDVAAVLAPRAGPGGGLGVLGIDECTGVVLQGDGCRVLGPGTATRYRMDGGRLVTTWILGDGESLREGCR